MKQASLLLFLFLSLRVALASEPFAVNKAHLLSLIERIQLNGDTVCVVDIYSDFPSYKPVEAKGEGFASIDDAARADVFLIRYNKYFRKNEDESIIIGLTKFIMQMQTDSGLFYNFLERHDGTVRINEEGRTSYASFGWWSARAMWALGEAAVYFKNRNGNLYKVILEKCEKAIPQIDSLLEKYDMYDAQGNPTWLLYGDGGDATSELVLGLNKFYEATGDCRYIDLSRKFCDGMAALQNKSASSPSYGIFYSNHNGWHGWANSQSTAILDYARLSHDSSMAENAFREVNHFLPHLAGAQFFRSCGRNGSNLDYSGQIAYDIRPAVTAASCAFEMTHDKKYKILACFFSSWFFGNNTARAIFYSSNTGICLDGTEDSIKLNRNSGAESTIEALLTMLELKKIGADFKNITLLSSPSFRSDSYLFNIDGKRIVVNVGEKGLKIK